MKRAHFVKLRRGPRVCRVAKGRFIKGNNANPGGLTLKQRRAKQRLLDQMAEGAEPAGETITKAARGEQVDKVSLDASKYIADQTIGQAGASNELKVSGITSKRCSFPGRSFAALTGG